MTTVNTKAQYMTAEDAAYRLGMTPDALRAAARRHARKGPDGVMARLAPGIVAVRFGKRRWLFLLKDVD